MSPVKSFYYRNENCYNNNNYIITLRLLKKKKNLNYYHISLK